MLTGLRKIADNCEPIVEEARVGNPQAGFCEERTP